MGYSFPKDRSALTSALITVGLVFFYATNSHVFYHEIGVSPIKPVFIYISTAFLICFAVMNSHRQVFFDLLPLSFVVWLGLFCVALILSYLYSSQSPFVFRKLIGIIKFLGVFVGFVALLRLPNSSLLAQRTLIAVLLFGVIVHLYEFSTFEGVGGRVSGVYTNPNYAALMLTFAMLAAIPAVPRLWRIPFILLAGFGIFTTVSRSGIMLWGLATVGLFFTGYLGRISILKACLAGVFGLAALAVIMGAAGELIAGTFLVDYLDKGTAARLGVSSTTFSDWSFDGRVRAAALALQMFSDQPFFGNGFCSTREWRLPVAPHNTYLMLGAEGGIVAVLVFLYLMGSIFVNTDYVGRLIVIIYAASSFITHNNLDHMPVALILAVAISRFDLPRQPFSQLSSPLAPTPLARSPLPQGA